MSLLTIAYPTYKRPFRVKEAVVDTLRLESDEIEVIVCDNNEDSKTKDILSSIEDSRFHYHSNGKNLGFCGNFKSCIMNAKGEFVLIVSDEDRVNHSAIFDILHIIKDWGGSKKEVAKDGRNHIWRGIYRGTR